MLVICSEMGNFRAKFLFSSQTPLLPSRVCCLSKGQEMNPSSVGSLTRQAWQRVWPQKSSRGILSPWSSNGSSHTLHSRTVDLPGLLSLLEEAEVEVAP